MALYGSKAGYGKAVRSYGLGGRNGSSGGSGIRNGLLTIITAVIVILLAVLAVLTLTTANASKRLTDRQASMTSESYQAESAAQNMLANLDGQLAQARNSGQSSHDALQSIAATATTTLAQTGNDQVQAQISVDGSTITAHYTTSSGRILDVTVQVKDDLTYEITSWLATTQEDQSTDTQNLLGSN